MALGARAHLHVLQSPIVNAPWRVQARRMCCLPIPVLVSEIVYLRLGLEERSSVIDDTPKRDGGAEFRVGGGRDKNREISQQTFENVVRPDIGKKVGDRTPRLFTQLLRLRRPRRNFQIYSIYLLEDW